MRKILGMALAGCMTALTIGAYTQRIPRDAIEPDRDEALSEPDGNGGDRSDYWITRNTYPTGNFNPQWVLDAGVQERAIVAAAPAGPKTYDAQHARKLGSPLALEPGQFVPLGPAPENNAQMSFGHVSGRVNVIRVDPTTTTSPSITAYSGTDGGGIWKTTNCCDANTTWQVMTDVPEVSSTSISDLVLDPTNHNVIYAGTGDLNFGSFSFGAYGVLKSIDGGQTWSLKGAAQFTPFYPGSANGFPQYQAVGKVAVDPNHPNIVMAGTKTSLYISYDAGDNWAGPCFTNQYALPNNAAGPIAQRQDVTGLIPVDNGDGTTRLYVAIGTRGAATPVQADLANRGSNGVYLLPHVPSSGCPAIGDWALLNNGWPAGTGNGVGDPPLGQTTPPAPTQIGRIEIAVAPNNPQRMYAQTEHAGNKNIEGIYRSDDAGATWTQLSANGINADLSNMGCNDGGVSTKGGSQMWYDAGLTVDPNDPNRVYMSTTDLNLSTDAGLNFRDVTCGWTTSHSLNGGVRVHVDQHARAFVGNDSTQMLIGTDGGLFYSSNVNIDNPAAASGSSAVAWTQLNDSVNSIEFYFGDISGNFANATVPAIGAGAQDNGCSAAHFGGDPTGAVLWNSTCGGDGTTTKIEPVKNLIYFNSSQNGSLARSLTFGSTFSGGFSSFSGNTRDPGVTTGSSTWGGDPVGSIFAMSYDLYKWGVLDAPGSGCDSSNGCNHMIAGTTRLWENVDAMNPTTATGRSAWKARTMDLTKDALNTAAGDIRSYINYVAYSFTNPTVAAVATNDGNVQIVFGLGTAVSANCPLHGPPTADCANAVNVTDNNTVLPNRPIFGVRFDPTTELVAYAAIGGFNANTPTTPGHVFRVTCTANCATFTWADKTGNLPDIPVEQVMPNPNQPQQVFAGTDWGLYFTDDITQPSPTWYRFDSFPHVMVWELVVDRGFTTLAAFTRSRGAWVWPLTNAPVGTLDADVAVTNSGPASANAGANVSYTLTLTNNGPNAAPNVVLNNPTPVNLTLVSVTGDCPNQTLPCQYASVNSGAVKVVTVTYAIPASYNTATAITDVASVSSSAADPVSANNSASVVTQVTTLTDLFLTMSGPSNAARGTPVSYTITVLNYGPSRAHAVSVADTTPPGLTFVSNSGDCATAFPCTFPILEAGVSRQIVATFTVPVDYAGAGPIGNTANASTTDPDSNAGNNTATVNTALADLANLSVSQTGPQSSQVGDPVTYVITVANAGPSPAANVVLTDPTPNGVIAVGITGDCVTLPCTIPTLAPGASFSATVQFNVPPNYVVAPVVNIASATSDATDPSLNDNISAFTTTIGTGADVRADIAAPPTVAVGGRMVYTTTVTNIGPSPATNVQLDSTMPAGLVFASNAGDCTVAFPCSLGTLQPAEAKTVTTTACVPPNYSGSILIASSANVTTTTSDPNGFNNSSSAFTSLVYDVLFSDGFESCP